MKYIFRTLVILGAILVWGTAGASDHNSIDGLQIMLQVSIAAVMMGVGYIGLKVLNKIERSQHSQCRKRSKAKNIRYRDYITVRKGLSR